MPLMARENRYRQLLEEIFFKNYRKDAVAVPFARAELETAARKLRVPLPKNLGDVIYAVRYRIPLPERVLALQPAGKEWVIEGTGKASYEFRLVTINRIRPNAQLVAVKVPDATPQIIAAYALTDEQALLAKVRYNKLVDIFLGITTYSLQNHLRTSVKGVGQIEIDEIYVGIDRHGRQYVLPVQAKGGKDQLGVIQTKQDLMYCAAKYPNLVCKALSAQFLDDDVIAMFELTVAGDEIKIVEERHYKLVPRADITAEDLKNYANRAL